MKEGAENLSRIKSGTEARDVHRKMYVVGERSMRSEAQLESWVEYMEVRMPV